VERFSSAIPRCGLCQRTRAKTLWLADKFARKYRQDSRFIPSLFLDRTIVRLRDASGSAMLNVCLAKERGRGRVRETLEESQRARVRWLCARAGRTAGLAWWRFARWKFVDAPRNVARASALSRTEFKKTERVGNRDHNWADNWADNWVKKWARKPSFADSSG
jgi:hypothetical protein